jgi:hypothetical protein
MLADFGVSKVHGAADTLTSGATVVGTPAYMSPEQLHGLPDIDERSDIYSLGLVGYAMLTGREPFSGVADVAAWRLTHDPEPLATAAPPVPPGLAAIIMQCLARDRSLRWPDVRRLKEALVRADPDSSAMLPEAVRDLPGYGQYALVWLVVWTALALVPNHPPRNMTLLLLLAALVPVGLSLHIWNVGRGGLRYPELARVACWPPQWWGMWWPRSLRRPTDLWMRLPWPARLARGTLSVFFVALPTLILWETRRPSDAEGLNVVKYALLIGTSLVTAGTLWWARRKGLGIGDAVRVLFGATMPSPAWQTPPVARLIEPIRGVRPPDYRRPADCVRAIDDVLPLAPQDSIPLGADVTIRAHRLLAAIEQCDEDIAWFDRYSGAGELERLEAAAAELEEDVSARGDRRGDLRRLVSGHLAVVHRMRADREVTVGQRAGLFDLLRGLWLQSYRLYEASPGAPQRTGDPRESLRALCAEVDEVLDASRQRDAPTLLPG